MRHAVIMAGGSGTRFWPASRTLRPKQLLSLASDAPLLRATWQRLQPLFPPERTWVVTTAATAEVSRQVLPEIPESHVVAEPVGRDTAACVGLAAHVLLHHDRDASFVVLPADHVVGQAESFRSALAAGLAQVEADGGLLTFGVRPTHPETGFGYLLIGDRHCLREGWSIHRLESFVEKPDVATAAAYLEAGDYLWNSGMFAWRARDLLAEMERLLPVLAAGLERAAMAMGSTDEAQVLAEVYPTLPRTSVDFGIMERAGRRWTIPVDFPWSDVGSWPALYDLLDHDQDHNAIRGRVLALDSSDNLLVSDGPAVTVAGVQDLVVVATADAVLVVPRDRAQKVKDVVQLLKSRGWDDLL